MSKSMVQTCVPWGMARQEETLNVPDAEKNDGAQTFTAFQIVLRLNSLVNARFQLPLSKIVFSIATWRSKMRFSIDLVRARSEQESSSPTMMSLKTFGIHKCAPDMPKSSIGRQIGFVSEAFCDCVPVLNQPTRKIKISDKVVILLSRLLFQDELLSPS